MALVPSSSHSRPLLTLLSSFQCSKLNLPMTGFEPWISGDRSHNHFPPSSSLLIFSKLNLIREQHKIADGDKSTVQWWSPIHRSLPARLTLAYCHRYFIKPLVQVPCTGGNGCLCLQKGYLVKNSFIRECVPTIKLTEERE